MTTASQCSLSRGRKQAKQWVGKLFMGVSELFTTAAIILVKLALRIPEELMRITVFGDDASESAVPVPQTLIILYQERLVNISLSSES
ncbi:MAG: hypothetical protein AAF609_03330 [Cyanobacteria bacterium P01_C01_bin.120]